MYKQDLALNNVQRLICHKSQKTNQHTHTHTHTDLSIYLSILFCSSPFLSEYTCYNQTGHLHSRRNPS